jgi:molybdate transport system substrate-binding protein
MATVFVSGEDNRVLSLFTSNAARSVLDALAPRFEAATGCKLVVEFDSAKTMLARIEAGEGADVAVLNAPHVDRLVELGLLDGASRRPFARSHIGVAVRAGEAHPDVSSVEALTHTLLNARAIAHTVHGASGMYVPELLRRLGIAEAVREKILTRPGGLIGRLVASGEADIAIQQISELLAVPGIELVGLLPPEVQKTLESAAAVFSAATGRAEAHGLIEFFRSPQAAPVFREKGLEPASG